MAEGVELPARARGTALFADISGFTPLTEALVDELGARRGGEELTRHLNRVYGALIHQVHCFRGSVIGFSGDAITCWFPDDEGRRATTCGLRLQAAMRELGSVDTPSGATHALSIKVAVTGGVARRLRVGAPDVQVIDVLAGAMLDRLAHAEGLAERGTLVVGAEVHAALPPGTAVVRWRGDGFAEIDALPRLEPESPWPPLGDDAIPLAQLRPWLQPAVWERVRDQQAEFLAELRPAVALFVRFSGLDFETNDGVGEQLDAYVRWTQQVLERYGGTLVQLTTGDKGSYLYAVFGAPVAHEDDVERALAAAAILREPPLRASGVEAVQLGMSRGRVRAGAYGSETRRTYGALGHETNVAARLMSHAAPGQLLVSPRIATAAAPGHVLRPLGEVVLKGKREPLAVFGYEGRREAAPTTAMHAPIVGRARERAVLHEEVERLRSAGTAGVVLLEGEAGIGKSSLLRDLVEHARSGPRALPVLVAAADALESSTAFYAWRAVFWGLLGVEPTHEPAAIQARVLARLPEGLHPLAPLLGAVIDAMGTIASDDPRVHGSLRAASLPRYLAAVFAALTRAEPTVLVVEDAHWLDSSSWALLTLVVRAHPALLAVVSTRPPDAPPEPYRALRAGARTRFLALAAMEPDDVLALVSRCLGVERVPERVARLIHDKAEGNPFFGEELAYALREAGLVGVEDGACVFEAPDLEAFDFPDTIEALVTSRIDRLAPSDQSALKVASVIGRAFDVMTLRDLLSGEAERTRLPDSLGRMTATGLMLCETPWPRASYLFKHAITRDVAYNLMLFEQRRELHRAVADWYERVHADDLAPYLALLAQHRVKAVEGLAEPAPERVREAERALARAGVQALESGATLEALGLADQGLALLPWLPASRERDELELELRSVRGSALVLIGGPTHEEVPGEFDRARQLCQALGETARLFEALFGIWYFNFIRADGSGSLTFSQRMLEMADVTGLPAFRSRAQEARGCSLICEGRLEEGLACMNEAIELSAGSGVAVGVAQSRDSTVIAHDYRAWAHCFLGYPDRARDDALRAIELAEGVSHPLAMAQAVSFGAHVFRYRREIAEVEALARRGLAICVEHGFLMWHAGNVAALGWVALTRGEVEDAVAQLETALGMARELELGIIAMIARMDLIAARTALGRFDDALAIVDEARAVQRDRLLGFCAPETLLLEAGVWLGRGDEPRAEACMHAALEQARATRARWFVLRAARQLAELWRGRGRSAQGRELLAPIVEGIDEGRDTQDVVDAVALLGALEVSEVSEISEVS
ncbi:MAG: AAA family ATPase [Myxococcales bacterium]|nr:AAA family ATPase [Myxococcales bacterium]